MGGFGGMGRNAMLEAIRMSGRATGGRTMMGGTPPAGSLAAGGEFRTGGVSLTPPEPPAWARYVDTFMQTPPGKALKALAMIGSTMPSRIDTTFENIEAAGGIRSGRGLLSAAGAFPSLATLGAIPAIGSGQNPFQPAREDGESTWEKTKRLYGWAEFLNDHGPEYMQEHDWTRRVVGFVGDVAFDPVTYVTFGTGSLAVRSSTTIARELTAASLKAGAKTTLGQKLAAASARVSKSHSKTAAGREALEHLGYDFGLGMSLPGTGRMGRLMRVDRAMDKLSGGAVTRMRVDQLGHSQRVGTWLQGQFVHTPLPVPGGAGAATFTEWFTKAVGTSRRSANRMVDDYAEALAPRITSPRIDVKATRGAVRAAREAGEAIDLSMFGRSPEMGHWGKDIVVRVDDAGGVASRVQTKGVSRYGMEVGTPNPVVWIAGPPEGPLAHLLDLIDWSATPMGRGPMGGIRPVTLGDEAGAAMTRASVVAGGTPADVQSLRRLVASAQRMRVGFQINNPASDLVVDLFARAAGSGFSYMHKAGVGRWFVQNFDRQRSIRDLMRSSDPATQHLGQSIKQADARGFRWGSEFGSYGEVKKRSLVDIINDSGLDTKEVRIAMEEEWRYADGSINPNIEEFAPSVFNAGEEVHRELLGWFPGLKAEWEGITGGRIRSDLGTELYVTRVPNPAGRRLLALDAGDLDIIGAPGQRGFKGPWEDVSAAGKAEEASIRGMAGALKARNYRVGAYIWGQELVQPGQALVYTVRRGPNTGARTVLRNRAPSVTMQMELLGEEGVRNGDLVAAGIKEWTPMFEKDILEVVDSYMTMMAREIHWAGIEEWLTHQGIMLTGDQVAKLRRLRDVQRHVATLREADASLTKTARSQMHAARRGVSAAEQLSEPLADTLSTIVGPQHARARARRVLELEAGDVPIEDMSLDELLSESSGLRSVIDGLSDEIISALTAVDLRTKAASLGRVRVTNDIYRWTNELITSTAAVVETRRMVAHFKRVANRLTQLEQIGAVERSVGKTFVEGSRVVHQPLRNKAGSIVGHEWTTPRGDYLATKEKGRWVVRLNGEEVGRVTNLQRVDELVKTDLARLPLDRPVPPTPRPGRGRRPEGLTFGAHRREGERLIRDRILAPEQSGLAKLSNEARVQVLFDELEESLDYLDEIAQMAPKRLRALGMQDSSVKALQELTAGLRGERLGAEVPAEIRSYVNEVQRVKALEAELDLADLMPYRHEDGIANLKMGASEASEGGMGEAYWAGRPEEVKFTDDFLERLKEETLAEMMAARARGDFSGGSPVPLGRGRAAEEVDMADNLLSEAVAELEAAGELLARSGQRATGEVAPYGGRGAGGLFFPHDPDWIPRRAYTKKTPLTTEDVPLPVSGAGKRPRTLDPALPGMRGTRAGRVLSGEKPISWREATAYDNINMAEAAILQARRFRAEAKLLESGTSEMGEINDIVASLAQRHPYMGGSVSGTDLLHMAFWQGAQEFGPNSYILGASASGSRGFAKGVTLKRPGMGQERMPVGENVLTDIRRADEDALTTAFRPGSPLGNELTTVLADLVRISTPGDMNKFVRYLATFINFVKAASISRPSFFQRNMFGGVFNNFLAGVEMGNTTKFITMRRAAMKAGWMDTVENWNRTAQVRGLTPMDDTSWQMFDKRRPIAMKEDAVRRGAAILADSGQGGKTWNKYDMEIFSDVYEANLFGAGQAGAEVARGARVGGVGVDRKYGGKVYLNPFRSDFVWYDAVRQRNMEIEEILRGSLAYDTLATKGGSLEDAAARVIRYHFNYDRQAQTATEAAIRQHVVPFYVWSRNSIPLMMARAARDPRKFLAYFRLRENLQHGVEGDRNTPEWYGHQYGLMLPIKWKGNRVFAFPDMPFMDLVDLVNAATGVGEEGVPAFRPLGLFRHGMTMVGPQIRVPLEVIRGKQFFAGLPLSTDPKPLPEMLDIPIIREALLAMPLLGIERNKAGQIMAPDNILYVMQNAFPLLGQMRRLRPRQEGQRERLGAAWTSWLLPMQLRQLTTRERLAAERARERLAGVERRQERSTEEGW